MTWILITEWLTRGVLLFLVLLSVWSIGLIIKKIRLFKVLSFLKEDKKIGLEGLKDLKPISKDHPVLKPYLELLLNSQSVTHLESQVSFFLGEKEDEMNQGVGALGTIGAIAPFIGLLGTVMGIIVAFGKLSLEKVSSQGIMYLLAEALILTAVGLVVAIPAVTAFNFFNRKKKEVINYCLRLKDLRVGQITSGS